MKNINTPAIIEWSKTRLENLQNVQDPAGLLPLKQRKGSATESWPQNKQKKTTNYLSIYGVSSDKEVRMHYLHYHQTAVAEMEAEAFPAGNLQVCTCTVRCP